MSSSFCGSALRFLPDFRGKRWREKMAGSGSSAPNAPHDQQHTCLCRIRHGRQEIGGWHSCGALIPLSRQRREGRAHQRRGLQSSPFGKRGAALRGWFCGNSFCTIWFSETIFPGSLNARRSASTIHISTSQHPGFPTAACLPVPGQFAASQFHLSAFFIPPPPPRRFTTHVSRLQNSCHRSVRKCPLQPRKIVKTMPGILEAS